MSQVVLCDLCGNSCQGSDFFHLSGWWGKHLRFDAPKPKDRHWEPKLMIELEQMQADVCRQCVLERLDFLQLHIEPSRNRTLQERQAQYPNESLLKAMRLTSPAGVDDVFCDICQTSCYEKHLRFQSQWKTSDDSTTEAEVCDRCVESRLKPLIRFQLVELMLQLG